MSLIEKTITISKEEISNLYDYKRQTYDYDITLVYNKNINMYEVSPNSKTLYCVADHKNFSEYVKSKTGIPVSFK